LLPFFVALRSSPSGLNLQPWRFGVDGKTLHVYSAGRFSDIDLGIVIGSAAALAREANHEPQFAVTRSAPTALLGGKYCVTVSIEKRDTIALAR
jgi:hypothetical protein